jgi:RNA polymerase sigma factor (sigma-70 family)
MMGTDKETWTRFLNGDRFSFKLLLEAYYMQLVQYGSKFSPDKELIKDCIQELFLNLWNRREALSIPANVKAYLFASFRRSLLRKITTASRTSNLDVSNGDESFNLEITIEERYIISETNLLVTKSLAEAVNSLPVRQKEVVYLKYFHSLDRDHIADAMNISAQTVSNLLQTALKQLRKALITH